MLIFFISNGVVSSVFILWNFYWMTSSHEMTEKVMRLLDILDISRVYKLYIDSSNQYTQYNIIITIIYVHDKSFNLHNFICRPIYLLKYTLLHFQKVMMTNIVSKNDLTFILSKCV